MAAFHAVGAGPDIAGLLALLKSYRAQVDLMIKSAETLVGIDREISAGGRQPAKPASQPGQRKRVQRIASPGARSIDTGN